MNKVNNFDPEKYKELLEKLGNCRRGIKSNTFYEGLSCIVPGGYISTDMLYKIFHNQYYERQQHQLSGLPPALKGARKSECAPTRRNSPSGGVT